MKKTQIVLLLLLFAALGQAESFQLETWGYTGYIESILRATPHKGIEAGQTIRVRGGLSLRDGMATFELVDIYHEHLTRTWDNFDHPVSLPLDIGVGVDVPISEINGTAGINVTYRGPFYEGGNNYQLHIGNHSFNYNNYLAYFGYTPIKAMRLSNVIHGPWKTDAFFGWSKVIESPVYGFMASYQRGIHALDLAGVSYEENQATTVDELVGLTNIQKDRALSANYTLRHNNYGTFELFYAQHFNAKNELKNNYHALNFKHTISPRGIGMTLVTELIDIDPLFQPRFSNPANIRSNYARYHRGKQSGSLELKFAQRQISGSLKIYSYLNRATTPHENHLETTATLSIPMGKYKLFGSFLYDQQTEKSPLHQITLLAPEFKSEFRVEPVRTVNIGAMVITPRLEFINQNFKVNLPNIGMVVQELNSWNLYLSTRVARGTYSGMTWKLGFKKLDYAFERPFSESNLQDGKHLWGELRYRTPSGFNFSLNYCYPKIKDGYWSDGGFVRLDRLIYRNNLFEVTYRKNL